MQQDEVNPQEILAMFVPRAMGTQHMDAPASRDGASRPEPSGPAKAPCRWSPAPEPLAYSLVNSFGCVENHGKSTVCCGFAFDVLLPG